MLITMNFTPESQAVVGLRIFAALVRQEIRGDEDARPLPVSAAPALREAEAFLQGGGELHRLPDEQLVITSRILRGMADRFGRVEHTDQGRAVLKAMQILGREVHVRSEGGTRPLQVRDTAVLIGLERVAQA